ncbi:ATP-binding protein [Streptomyces catenulae]|uniref:ATP-binding protein n=1 Tax=Streptomyces catenulae TaxID=66875 RepID=A0ABV2YVY7_9ACTN|nr:ATP-binding protein [Streptomyces catenulae]
MIAGLESLRQRHVLTLPTVPAAVRVARETAEQVLAEWHIGAHHPTVGPALLILAELVTNSVRHAAPLSTQLTVVYAARRDRLVVAVHDRHPYLPTLYGATVGSEDGGLATVMELTLGLGGTAGVLPDADGEGKTVRVCLPL